MHLPSYLRIYVSCFVSFNALEFRVAGLMQCFVTPFTPTIQSKDKKKSCTAVEPDAQRVTMVIFNNATSSQSQSPLSHSLSQLQTPHTNEGYGKMGHKGLRSIKTTPLPPTTHTTHTHTHRHTKAVVSSHKRKS